MTKDELEKSIAEGDAEKQELMKSLILALPYHSDDLAAIENLARQKATTKPPSIEPEVPEDLKILLKNYGLLGDNEKSIGLAPLPIIPNVDSPSLLVDVNNESPNAQALTLKELNEHVKKASLVEPKDYESFKPLLVNGKNVGTDMEELFKQFGLTQDGYRVERKKLPNKDSSVPSIESSYLNPSHSKLLSNIGIAPIDDGKGKKNQRKPSTNVFKPTNMKAQSDDYKRLEQILDTIKELEKTDSTQSNKYVRNQSTSSSNIDPVKYSIRSGPKKNEVKRQQADDTEPTKLSLNGTPLLESSLESTDDDTSSTTEKTTTTTTESTTSTTTEASDSTTEDKKNLLEDEIEVTPEDEIQQLPSPRRSGFYMILDWNSFLEVGEDPQKIVVRFNPKIGDPTRFLPVNV